MPNNGRRPRLQFLLLMLQLPAFQNIHTLSASRAPISAAALGPRGDWLALGCAALGQLLVWEWRSETYVLRQQGHHHDVAACAFSPDGALLATGADDAKVHQRPSWPCTRTQNASQLTCPTKCMLDPVQRQVSIQDMHALGPYLQYAIRG